MYTGRPHLLLLLCFGAACSDYNLAGGKGSNTDAEAEGVPDIAVSPLDVAVEGACPTAEQAITVTNEGDGPLSLVAVGTTGDWTVAGISLPLTLAPAESVGFSVVGSGEGSLQIESDDPDENIVEVPLFAAGDQAPSISIVAPGTGEILAPGEALLSATVADAEDAADRLLVNWDSDVDGAIAGGAAAPSGDSLLVWGASRSQGDHLLTATVTDSCGNETSTQVQVCQQAGYTVDQLDLSSWHFEGDAQWDASNDWLQLTRASQGLVGTAFATDSTVRADNVEISFRFYIGDGSGADGISLTALDSARMTTFLGGTGCGIGYGGDASCTVGPALPGWTLEVDTYDNGSSVEPTPNDHLAFTFDGDVDAYVAWAELPEMEDTGWHDMTVVVAAPRLTVSIDGVTYIDQDLSGSLAFDAYVGFTAGTGGETNLHLIDSLSVTEVVCVD